MKIHEYQAKLLFREYQIPVPEGYVIFSPGEIEEIAKQIDTFPVAVKAQIHAGGRGQGGGVKLAYTKDEIIARGKEIFGMNLVTVQTGAAGRQVKKLLIEQGVDIHHEYYVSLIADRASSSVLLIVSSAGGMDIEKVAKETPEKIIRVSIDISIGLQPYHIRKAVFSLNLPHEIMKSFGKVVRSLYDLFVDQDCSQIEINPLIVTPEQKLFALDAKIQFDDSALFRHPELKKLHDQDEEDPLEAEAARFNLNYIKLEGNVGNMVNGAGLAMATMDIVKLAGAEPANFLDVGGGASAEMVENGFRIILKDPGVQVIFVNIFGGILRCDVLAQGIVQAAQNCQIQVPVVVRMEGTNVERGRAILAESGINVQTAKNLQDAGEKIATFLGGAQ